MNTTRVRFLGNELTRGEYGESIIHGYEQDNQVYIWDSTYGWFNYGPYDPELWEKLQIMGQDEIIPDW